MQNEGLTTGRQGGWLAMTFPLLLGVFLGLVNGFVFHFFFFFFCGEWIRKMEKEKEKEKVDDSCLLLLNMVLHVMTTLTLMLKFVTTHSLYGVFGLISMYNVLYHEGLREKGK
jgi:surface polysaccharide O-acyltransferase-like enzyme